MPKRCDEKRNRKSRRITSQQENSLADGFARGCYREHAGKNGSDARRPAERKREAHQKPADSTGLAAEFAGNGCRD